jgi:hypothetical protein
LLELNAPFRPSIELFYPFNAPFYPLITLLIAIDKKDKEFKDYIFTLSDFKDKTNISMTTSNKRTLHKSNTTFLKREPTNYL